MSYWPELRPETSAKIEAALRRGDKIDAIKIYREASTADLKDAKDAIERASHLIPADKPKPAAAPRTPKRRIPWMPILIAAGIIALIVWIYYLVQV
jgi:hypothetical protein